MTTVFKNQFLGGLSLGGFFPVKLLQSSRAAGWVSQSCNLQIAEGANFLYQSYALHIMKTF